MATERQSFPEWVFAPTHHVHRALSSLALMGAAGAIKLAEVKDYLPPTPIAYVFAGVGFFGLMSAIPEDEPYHGPPSGYLEYERMQGTHLLNRLNTPEQPIVTDAE